MELVSTIALFTTGINDGFSCDGESSSSRDGESSDSMKIPLRHDTRAIGRPEFWRLLRFVFSRRIYIEGCWTAAYRPVSNSCNSWRDQGESRGVKQQLGSFPSMHI